MRKREGWYIKITRYINATDYDLMCGGECYGSFPSVEELSKFADMLQGDLKTAKMSDATRASYEEIIAAIREVEGFA